jgi:hypothetical protein
MNDTHDRRRRIAAALEKQFDQCNEAAERLLAAMAGSEPDYFNMPIAIALLRTSGQLGAAIARLEARADGAPPPPEKSEIHGSITK